MEWEILQVIYPREIHCHRAIGTVSGEDLFGILKKAARGLETKEREVKSGLSAPTCVPQTQTGLPISPSDVSSFQLFFWSGPPRFLLVNHRVVLHSPRAKTSTEAEQQMFQAIMGCISSKASFAFPCPVLPDELGYRIKSPVVSQSMVYILGRAWVVFWAAGSAPPTPPGSPQNYPLDK